MNEVWNRDTIRKLFPEKFLPISPKIEPKKTEEISPEIKSINSSKYSKKIGIDVGGVLLAKGTHISDAVYSVLVLSLNYECYIISYRGKNIDKEQQRRIHLRKLGVDRFIPEMNWIFTKSREEKGIVCREMGIDIMIDDKEEVMDSIKKYSPVTMCIHFGHSPYTTWEKILSRLDAK